LEITVRKAESLIVFRRLVSSDLQALRGIQCRFERQAKQNKRPIASAIK
jgi:hypothetical protein